MRGGSRNWIGRVREFTTSTLPGSLPASTWQTQRWRTLGREGTFKSHIRGALNIGLTQDQVIEVFGHMTLYTGIAFAQGAMDVANEIFNSA